ncbi:MAG: hypothetical protein Q4B48_05540 [Syntrophomonadaceae bacterium]|nr:hypothetical protein [Syntrophomonadaceae bacterium]
MAVQRSTYGQSAASRVLVCVDDIVARDARGRLYTSFLEQPMLFNSIMEMFNLLDDWFDRSNFPQTTHEYRSFKGTRPVTEPADEGNDFMAVNDRNEQGEKATFIIHVQFRQNASWQGTIQWVNEKKTQRFRSALEMIKLIDGALQQEEDDGIGWQE